MLMCALLRRCLSRLMGFVACRRLIPHSMCTQSCPGMLCKLVYIYIHICTYIQYLCRKRSCKRITVRLLERESGHPLNPVQRLHKCISLRWLTFSRDSQKAPSRWFLSHQALSPSSASLLAFPFRGDFSSTWRSGWLHFPRRHHGCSYTSVLLVKRRVAASAALLIPTSRGDMRRELGFNGWL